MHKPNRIRELEHRRTWNAKHFLRDDGLIEAEISMHPVHYQDSLGKWQDIDIRPREKAFTKAAKKVGRQVKKFDLAVKDAGFCYRLARKANGWFLFEQGGAAISWQFPGAQASPAVISGSKVLYPGALDGADIAYAILPEGVKEEIVLRDDKAPNTYTVVFEADYCWPRQIASGALEWVKQDGSVAFVTRPPIAIDAAGALEQVGVVLAQVDEDTWEYQLVLAEGWLSDPARTWPVIIDPTTTTIQPSTADTYINSVSGYRDNNYGINDRFDVGYESGNMLDGLLKFDLSSIPAGANITNGELQLYFIQNVYSNSQSIGIYRITSDWVETTVTYNTEPTYDSATAYGTLAISTSTTLNVWHTCAISATLLSNWKSGAWLNYGFRMRCDGSSLNSRVCTYASREYATAAYRPKLLVTYNQPPTAPTNLSPGGTSASPARINIVTPTLTWTHSDPDGDAQASYQVIITRDSDSVVVKDTGEVASATSSYAVPAGTLAEGVKYRWKVRTKDAAGLWSSYAAEVYIFTNRAPSATPTSPLGTSGSPAIIANSTTPRLQWSFSDPDGDAQAKYHVIIKRSSDNVTIRDTAWVTSANAYYDVPAGDLVYGTTYYWQVQVEDPYGRQSALTSAQYFTPQQTPNAPTGLVPAGTGADPAEVNTLTPTLSWVHNDPDSDPQQSFQVLIYRASDNALVHDSAEVASGTSSYSVPASVLSGSVKYYWRVRTKDTGSGQFSPYSADAYIYTNVAPQAPTGLNPTNGTVFDATQAKTFSWTFQDPDITPNGDAQSAYQLLIKRVSDGVTVYDSGKVASVVSQHNLPANTLTNGVDYQWQVKTWDSQDLVGPYSGLVAIRTGTPPAVSITSPLNAGTYGKGILTVQWSYSDTETDPQNQYQVVMKDAGALVIEDSGQLPGANTQHQFATILQNNTQYTVEVTAWDATGQSDTDVSTFTTNFVPPTTPVISAIGDDAGAKVLITITNPDDDPLKPATDRNDLHRREPGGAWVRIAKSLTLNAGYDDYAVASGVTYDYRVVAISVDETTAEATASAGITLTGLWLHDVSDPAATVLRIPYNTEQGEDWQPEAVLMRYAGRTRPVAEFGEMEDARFRVKLIMVRAETWWASLRALVRSKATLCAREPRGRKVFGVILSVPETDEHYGQTATLEVVETSYTEAV